MTVLTSTTQPSLPRPRRPARAIAQTVLNVAIVAAAAAVRAQYHVLGLQIRCCRDRRRDRVLHHRAPSRDPRPSNRRRLCALLRLWTCHPQARRPAAVSVASCACRLHAQLAERPESSDRSLMCSSSGMCICIRCRNDGHRCPSVDVVRVLLLDQRRHHGRCRLLLTICWGVIQTLCVGFAICVDRRRVLCP